MKQKKEKTLDSLAHYTLIIVILLSFVALYKIIQEGNKIEKMEGEKRMECIEKYENHEKISEHSFCYFIYKAFVKEENSEMKKAEDIKIKEKLKENNYLL